MLLLGQFGFTVLIDFFAFLALSQQRRGGKEFRRSKPKLSPSLSLTLVSALLQRTLLFKLKLAINLTAAALRPLRPPIKSSSTRTSWSKRWRTSFLPFYFLAIHCPLFSLANLLFSIVKNLLGKFRPFVPRIRAIPFPSPLQSPFLTFRRTPSVLFQAVIVLLRALDVQKHASLCFLFPIAPLTPINHRIPYGFVTSEFYSTSCFSQDVLSQY